MGPRRWSRGSHVITLLITSSSETLQWGHGVGAVDHDGRPSNRGRVQPTSMGPRRWSRGSRRPSAHGGKRHETTSMGPRRWSRGSLALGLSPLISVSALQWGHGVGAVDHSRIFEDHDRCWQTSMGPRRWSRGSRRTAWYGSVSCTPLQWGHGVGAVDHEVCRRPGERRGRHFNGATALEPWITRTGRTGRWFPGHFNGATALEPWITRIKLQSRVRVRATSMGPRRWSRGSPRRSSGSTRRKPATLQWGHGVGAVDH